MFKPGAGHSDRLLMLSSSIPASVWITEAKIDYGRFEVTGLTLEPSALNEWVDRLAVHPLMRGLKLSTVTVENRSGVVPGKPMAAASGAARPVWSFSLVNLEPPTPPVTVTKPAGGKP
jgi:Tfp pilus assembly protein PilN